MVRLSPDELTTLDEGIRELMAPFENRADADAPPGAIPAALTFAIPPAVAPDAGDR